MILTVEKDRGRLYDSNGTEILYAIWADTASGEVVSLVKDENGYVIEVQEDGSRGVKAERKTFAAPLQFVRSAYA